MVPKDTYLRTMAICLIVFNTLAFIAAILWATIGNGGISEFTAYLLGFVLPMILVYGIILFADRTQ